MDDQVTPPVGYTLDTSSTPQIITPPKGYTLDTTKADLPAELAPMVGHAMLGLLPAIGATVGTILAPEGAIPAMAAAFLGGGAGSAAQQGIGAATRSLPPPPGLAGGIVNAGEEGLRQAAYEGGGRFVNAALGRIFKRAFDPEQLYQSALKPPPGKGIENTKKIVQGGLEAGVPVDPGKWETNWQQLNSQIDNIISGGPQQRPIDPRQVASRLDALKQEWATGSGDPAYINAIDTVKNNFLLRYPHPITPEVAQEAKKQIYKEIRISKNSYYTADNSSLGLDAKAELASALRQELQDRYPQLEKLNAREGALIELEKALGRFAAREGNKQISSYFGPVAAGGAFLSGHPEAGLGVLATNMLRSMYEDPGIKSRLAIALYKAQKSGLGHAVGPVGPYVVPGVIRLSDAALRGSLPEPPRSLPSPPQ